MPAQITVTPSQKAFQSGTPATLPVGFTVEPSVDGSGNAYFAACFAGAVDSNGQPSSVYYVTPANPFPTNVYDASGNVLFVSGHPGHVINDAGGNIIGIVTTDQTTHGTTDLVAADIIKVAGTALSLGQKAESASIPVVLPSDAKVKNAISGTVNTILAGSTLNALANNGTVLSNSITWIQGSTGDGFVMGRLEMSFKFQTQPTANTGFSIWFIKTGNGLEDSSAPPCRPPDAVLGITPYGGSTDTNAHVVSVDVPIPVGTIKVLLKNDGTGQALTANNTDNVLYITGITQQQNV